MAKNYYKDYMEGLHNEYNLTMPVQNSKYMDIEQNYEGKRTFLNRTFDALNVGQFVSAGFAQGLVDEEITPFEGMVQGLMAANPLGKGRSEWEHSYQNVLETAGWKPETTAGKVAKFAIGFAGDVFLDPVNYLSGGLKGVIQGTGKHAANVATGGAKMMDMLGDSAKFIDNIGDISKSVGMTQDVAEAIVKNSKIFQSGNAVIDVASDAAELVQKYNQLLGFTAEKSADIVWSLSNVPFGKQIFGKAFGADIATKQYTVMSGEGLKLLGDATLAPHYAKLRNIIYGGKIGKLFASTHDLYKISQTNPEGVYDFVKWAETTQGLGADKLASKRAIIEEAKRVMDMTPAQANEMVELMENKTIWHKVKKTVNFFDTKEAEVFKVNIEAKKADTVAQLNEYEDFLKRAGQEKEIIEEALGSAKMSKAEAIEKFNMEKASKLLEIDIEYLDNADDVKRYLGALNDTSLKFEVKSFDVDVDDVEYLGMRYDQYRSKTTLQDLGDGVLDSTSINKEALQDFTKPSDMPNSTYYRLRNDLKTNGYKEYRSATHADKALGRLGEGWERVQLESGRVRVYAPGSIPKAGTTAEAVSALGDVVTKDDIVQDLSKYLFGNDNFISVKTYDNDVGALIQYAKTHTKEQTIGYALINAEKYSGKAADMYSFIGERIGYGTKHPKFKDWEEFYVKRMDKINANQAAGKFTRQDEIMADILEKARLERNILKHQFRDADSARDVANILGSINEMSHEDLANAYIKDVTKARLEIAADMGLEDAPTNATTKKSFHKKDKMSTNFEISEAQREHMMYKYSNIEYDNSSVDVADKSSEMLKNLTDSQSKLDSKIDTFKDVKEELEDVLKNGTGTTDKHNRFVIDKLTAEMGNLHEEISLLEMSVPKQDEAYKKYMTNYESTVKGGKYKPKEATENLQTYHDMSKAKQSLEVQEAMLKEAKSNLKALDSDLADPFGQISFQQSLEKKRLYAKQIDDLEKKIPLTHQEFVKKRATHQANIKIPSSVNANPGEVNRMNRIMDEMEYIIENVYGKELTQLTDKQIDVAFRWAQSRDLARGAGKDLENLGRDVDRQILNEINARTLKTQMEEVKKIANSDVPRVARNHKVQVMYQGNKYEAVVDEVLTTGKKTKDFVVSIDGDVIGTNQGGKDIILKSPTVTIGERNILGITGEVAPRNIDDLRRNSNLMDSFLTRQEDTVFGITKRVEELVPIPNEVPRSKMGVVSMEYKIGDTKRGMYNEQMLKGLDADKAAKVRAINNMSNDMLDTLEDVITELEYNKIIVDANLSNSDYFIDAYVSDIAKFDKLLTDANAFDTYIQSSIEFGTISKVDYDKVIAEYNPDMGKYLLDESLEIDDKVRNNIQWLRDELIKIGQDEVGIDKLKSGQLEANMYDYLPHILTDDGRKLLQGQDIKKTFAGFGDADGFGREFNPFGKSRTIKYIPDGAGGWIDKPSIKQINEFFKDQLNGKNMFSEDLSEIYLVRALKHNELMYDNKYMENMLDLFGEDFTGKVLANHTVSMNYGKLKDFSLQTSNTHSSLDMSDMISEHLSNEEVTKMITQKAHDAYKLDQSVPFKKVHSDLMSEEIQTFIDNTFTKEFKSDLYSKNFQRFIDETTTGGLLDDVGMPMTMLDDAQVGSLNTNHFKLKERYTEHIQKKYNNFLQLGGEYEPISGRKLHDISKQVRDLSIDDIAEQLNIALQTADEVDYGRIKSLLDKVDKFNNLKEPQIRQVQNAIVNKANQSRKISIMKDQSEFLKVYDKFTHFIKVNQTAVLPGFHGRNKTSNMFNNWLVIGQDATDIKFQREAAHAMQFVGGKAGLTDTMMKLADGGEIPWSDIVRGAEDFGVVDSGVFAAEIGVGNVGKGILDKIGVPGKFDPTNMKEFIPYKVGTKVGTNIENHDKIIHFAAQVKNGMSFKDAAASATKTLFDYGDLTMFEQTVMKRIFPYYTWMRKNSQFQLEMMLESPEKFRMVGKVMGGISNSVSDEDKINMAFVNEFAQDWIQTPFSVNNEKGNREPVLLNPNLPFMDVSRIPNPLSPVESAKELFTQMNPLFKVPLELMANYNAFFESPIAKEGESRVAKGAEYIASQMGVVPVAKGFVEKSGADLALHALNHSTGVKLLSYDYDTYKPMKILEIMDEQYAKEKLQRQVKRFGKGIVSGFNDAMSYAKSAIDTSIDVIADIAYNDRPIRPDEYTESLRPISEETYKSLPVDEREMYTPPTEKDAMRYHQKAVELEQRALQDTGVASKFIWSLLEVANIGSRNEPYQFGNVTRVKDGDTFDVNINGVNETVRLLLIDTAETEKQNQDGSIKSQTQPFADEATEFAEKALIDRDVKIFFDGTERDMYGRLLAYVQVDGEDYAEQILQAGLAQTGYVMQPPYSNLGKYQSAERSAYDSGKGIWGMKGYAQPDSNARYNSQIKMGDYNDYKIQKFNQMTNKRQNARMQTNPGLMDSIMRKLGQ